MIKHIYNAYMLDNLSSEQDILLESCYSKNKLEHQFKKGAPTGTREIHLTELCRSQTTVENCIGGHVNVLLDYKKT